MKKIVVKLDAFSMGTLISFLQFVVSNAGRLGFTSSIQSRHLLASVTELHEKLCTAQSPYKINYKVKMSLSMGLGFVALFELLPREMPVPDLSAITIDAIYQKIHQQL